MDRFAVFTYKNKYGKEISFSINSPLWLIDINGLSDNNINISTSQSVNQIGSTTTSKSVESKNITINGIIMDDIENLRKQLLSTIIPLDNGKLIYKRKGEEYYINVTPSQTPIIENGAPTQNFQISLFADYPFWRNTKGEIKYISGLFPSFKFPINYSNPQTHRFSTKVKSEFINVYNSGNAPTGFICVFKSKVAVKNPSILNVLTGEIMKIGGANNEYIMQPGEEIILSTYYGNKRITSILNNVATNIFKYRDVGSSFFQLQPGDNILKDNADENESQLDVYIEFENTFVGV